MGFDIEAGILVSEMKKLLILIAFFVVTFATVWAEQNKAEIPITEVQAIEIARHYAIEHDIRPASWFAEDSAWAEFDGEKWSVLFFQKTEEGKSVTLGMMELRLSLTPDGSIILPPEQ